jgi:hypothetical protein
MDTDTWEDAENRFYMKLVVFEAARAQFPAGLSSGMCAVSVTRVTAVGSSRVTVRVRITRVLSDTCRIFIKLCPQVYIQCAP